MYYGFIKLQPISTSQFEFLFSNAYKQFPCHQEMNLKIS